VQQHSATIVSRDTSINTTINAFVQSAMAEVKQELTTQLESVFVSWMILGAKFRSWDNFPWFFQK
jgi:hypothetical protein